MLNCFLFEKFYLHYTLCDFDSILLHYAKLFIRQSIDHEQIFDVTFENPPPIEKSCVRHWTLEPLLSVGFDAAWYITRLIGKSFGMLNNE